MSCPSRLVITDLCPHECGHGALRARATKGKGRPEAAPSFSMLEVDRYLIPSVITFAPAEASLTV